MFSHLNQDNLSYIRSQLQELASPPRADPSQDEFNSTQQKYIEEEACLKDDAPSPPEPPSPMTPFLQDGPEPIKTSSYRNS
jgi:hypothetical protein